MAGRPTSSRHAHQRAGRYTSLLDVTSQVEAAKADGRWDAAYEPQRTAQVAQDLAAALARDEAARTFFESLGRTDQYAVILRLSKSRGAASRAAQLRKVIDLLRSGQRIT